MHGCAEVVPNIAVSVGVGVVMGNHVEIERITFAPHFASPAVSIRAKNKVLFIIGCRTIGYFIGYGKVPVVPVNKIGGGEMITPEELLAKIIVDVKNVD